MQGRALSYVGRMGISDISQYNNVTMMIITIHIYINIYLIDAYLLFVFFYQQRLDTL